MQETVLTGESKDIVADNIEKLKMIFPEAFTESKIDFEKLQEVLGNYIEDKEERYNFTWNGKSKALRLSQTPSIGTLRPCKDESKNWDTTQNLYIEGDNLEVLKLLQKTYHSKIKMIYIDPPYNTGGDFVYKDDFKDNLQNYLRVTGQKDYNGNSITTNSESSGRYHTNWLNMIYPRLRLARNLITDDGVIFISIDDNEVENLKKLCNEVFGEDNFISQLVWEKKKKGTFLSNTITNIKEYLLVYSKNKDLFKGLIGEINSSQETYPCINASNKRDIRKIPAGISSKYREQNYIQKKGTKISVTTMDLILHSDLVITDGILANELIIEGNWRYTQESMNEYAVNNELYITQDLYIRRIVNEPREKTLKDLLSRQGSDENSSHRGLNVNNLFEDGWGSNEDGEEELRLLLAPSIMSFPKPRKLLEKIIASLRDEKAIILDFFAGSATTAHAVIDLNKEDGGNRKFIMVQLPENLDDNLAKTIGEAKKTIENAIKFLDENKKPHLLSEIGKERIRRAGEKIKEELENNNQQLKLGEEPKKLPDIGFKVFKLDSSNLKKWNPDEDNLDKALLNMIENYVAVSYTHLRRRRCNLIDP